MTKLNRGCLSKKKTMYRRVVSLLLLPSLLHLQQLSLGHAHGGSQPPGHDLASHIHINTTCHEHDDFGHHHHGDVDHHDGDDDDDDSDTDVLQATDSEPT